MNVDDCKQQLYTSTINAEQLVLISGNDVDESYDLGKASIWLMSIIFLTMSAIVKDANVGSIVGGNVNQIGHIEWRVIEAECIWSAS